MFTNSKESCDTRARKIEQILLAILVLNFAVALAKFVWGTISGSSAMENDGVASFFDAFANIAGLIGIKLASKPADKGHPYGHAKFETYASFFIGVSLLLACFGIAYEAVEKLISGQSRIFVDWISYAIMGGTLAINLGVSLFESTAGTKLRSEILKADAKHTRSDAYVSISVLLSLIFVNLGYPAADAIVSLIVAIAIFASALSIFREVCSTLDDHSRLDAEIVSHLVTQIDGVKSVHNIRSRGCENEIFVDLHALMNPNMTLMQAHEIASIIEDTIKESFVGIADVTVHMEPDIDSERK